MLRDNVMIYLSDGSRVHSILSHEYPIFPKNHLEDWAAFPMTEEGGVYAQTLLDTGVLIVPPEMPIVLGHVIRTCDSLLNLEDRAKPCCQMLAQLAVRQNLRVIAAQKQA